MQALTDSEFRARRGSTLAAKAAFWKSHLKGKFDLTPAQKLNFGRRVTALRLGIPITDGPVVYRRVVVES